MADTHFADTEKGSYTVEDISHVRTITTRDSQLPPASEDAGVKHEGGGDNPNDKVCCCNKHLLEGTHPPNYILLTWLQMTMHRFLPLVAMAFLWTGSQIPLYLYGSIPPFIYGDIGGVDRWIWFVLSYLLALASICPFVGSLSDLFGRRWTRARLEKVYAPWRALLDQGVGVHCGEAGCYQRTPHAVFLRWFAEVLDVLRGHGIGWALWNFRGAFGVLDSGREDAAYDDWHGHQLDAKLLHLLRSS